MRKTEIVKEVGEAFYSWILFNEDFTVIPEILKNRKVTFQYDREEW